MASVDKDLPAESPPSHLSSWEGRLGGVAVVMTVGVALSWLTWWEMYRNIQEDPWFGTVSVLKDHREQFEAGETSFLVTIDEDMAPMEARLNQARMRSTVFYRVNVALTYLLIALAAWCLARAHWKYTAEKESPRRIRNARSVRIR